MITTITQPKFQLAKAGLGVAESGAFMDAHEREHAEEISRRFQDRNVSTGQIMLFGLTGGLIPCPAAITVLLLCLQLKQLTLGVALVACFSIGLAVTMISVGVIASLSVDRIRKRWAGFELSRGEPLTLRQRSCLSSQAIWRSPAGSGSVALIFQLTRCLELLYESGR